MSTNRVEITGLGPMIPGFKGGSSLADLSFSVDWPHAEEEWFDPLTDIAGRGFRYFNNATRYALAAIRQMDPSDDSGKPERAATEASRRGIVLGSNTCARIDLDEFDRAIIQEGHGAIDPMRAPSFCANVSTGNLAIKENAKAFNLTLTNPITAGLEAVALGARAILDGRASEVIAGAMEDNCRITFGSARPLTLRGGAWLLRLEADDAVTEGRRPIACVGGAVNRFVPRGLAHTQRADVVASLRDELTRSSSAEGPLQLMVTRLDDPHSRYIFEVLCEALDGMTDPLASNAVSPEGTGQASILSIAQCSWAARSAGDALCVAISPLGHISAIEILGTRGTTNG